MPIKTHKNNTDRLVCTHKYFLIYFFLVKDDLIFIIMPSFWKFTHPYQKAVMMQII